MLGWGRPVAVYSKPYLASPHPSGILRAPRTPSGMGIVALGLYSTEHPRLPGSTSIYSHSHE